MKKTKREDGSVTYDRQDGSKPWNFSAAEVAEKGEARLDKHFAVPAYVPSAYSHPAEYAHMYDKRAHEED